MPNFLQRSNQLELLDNPNTPFAAIRANMQELNTINTLLGGHKITIAGCKQLLLGNTKPIVTVCEVGCGGGDNLIALHKWATKNNTTLHFIGIDINQNCIAFAKEQCVDIPATFICADYRKVQFAQKPDIIFSSLFCHHFSNSALNEVLQWKKTNAILGFFINDLQRNFFAYYAIKIITAIFSKSYLVKNDAPISVLRGFWFNEWQQLLVNNKLVANVRWQWAFRYLIVYKNA
jgi:2-polyprenyl-3-methyl-5-hydroxy-6-metoxy-1,4-benzoquinol methylase